MFTLLLYSGRWKRIVGEEILKINNSQMLDLESTNMQECCCQIDTSHKRLWKLIQKEFAHVVKSLNYVALIQVSHNGKVKISCNKQMIMGGTSWVDWSGIWHLGIFPRAMSKRWFMFSEYPTTISFNNFSLRQIYCRRRSPKWNW